MSLQIVYGRAGSGKSQFCFEEIKEKIKQEEKIYMITPEQFSFTAEKKMLEAINMQSCINAEVITFGRIANRILSQTGGMEKPIISESGKKMLLYDILSKGKDKLTFLGKSKENTEIVINALTELKKHCISSMQLKNAMEDVKDVRLKLKLGDILYCYNEFEKRIENTYYDENDTLNILVEKINQSNMFKDSLVYIDEFSGFTLQEYNVIEEILKQAKKVTVTLESEDLENDNEDYLFSSNNKMAHKLIKITNSIEKPIFLAKQYRFKNVELEAIERNLYSYPIKKYEEEINHIHLSLEQNPYSEIENVARKIVTLVKDKGYNYKDISVITRDVKQDGALIKAIFRAYDIPNFIDEKKELSQNILIRFLLSVFEILSKGWSTENVLASVKTGFFRLTEDEISDVENYALSWGIKGKRWYENDWKYGLETNEEQERMNNLRKKIVNPIINLKDNLSKEKTIRNMATETFSFLQEINAEETLKSKVEWLIKKGEIEIANEYVTGMKNLTFILDEMVNALGDEKLSFEKQLEIIKIGFTGNDLGAIPATLDQVIIGDIERSRSHKVRAVFVIGLNDGVFPSFGKDEGFLNDSDRHDLEKLSIELAKDSIQNLYEEQFSIYKAFTTAEEELFLSYPVADKEGTGLRPSNLVEKVKKILPKIQEENEITKKMPVIMNKKVTFDYLLTKIQEGNLDENWQAVFEIYKEDMFWKNRLLAAMDGLGDTNLPVQIDEKNIKKLYGNTIRTSVSRLEQYRKCPFSFHLKYGLKLKENPEFNIKSVDTGSFMHEVISAFFDKTDEKGIDYKQLTDDEIKQITIEIIQEELHLKKNELFLYTPKFRSLAVRLEKVISKAIKYIVNQLKQSDFRLVGSEIEFSDKSLYKPIRMKLETGEEIEVIGKIDRIDIAKDESGKYLRIIDYKSSAKSIDLGEVIAGLQIQLLTYLDAASDKECAIPAGVFYFGLIDNVIKAQKNKSDEEIEQELKKKFKLNGILLADVHVAKMMDNKLEKGYSDTIPAFIDKDGQLSMTRSNAINLEDFKNLQRHTKQIINKICKEILSGNIEMRPYKNKAKKSVCDYCNYRSICNFSPEKKGNEYFALKNMEKKEILETLKENKDV